MRKALLLILVLLLTVVCACAIAETEYPLDSISGRITFSKDLENNFVVLTPGNLSEHPDLVSSTGKTAEEFLSDWAERGVVLQAWGKGKNKTVVELTIVQDQASSMYFDTESRTRAERAEYKKLIVQSKPQGYTLFDVTIKKHEKSGNFVEFEYLYSAGGEQYRGIAGKIVRNGYSLTMDYQAYDRSLNTADRKLSRMILNAIAIDKVAAVPSSVSGQETPESRNASDIPVGAANTLTVTVAPPKVSNDGAFTVEGTAYPGSELVISAMRLSSTVSHHFNAVAGDSGKFKVKVALPEEGSYTLTIAMYINDTPVEDLFLDVVKYSSTQLSYQLNADIPDVLTMDKLIISGTTVKNVEIQCIVTVNNGNPLQIKPRDTVKTNGNGTFSFTVPTDQEGEYDFTLVFSKKGMNSERFTKHATRTFSTADQNARTAGKAEKVNYDKLIKKLDSYVGHTIVFDAYVTEAKQVGDQWMIVAAQKLNRGQYSNHLVYIAEEDPGLAAGTKVKLYGVCTGPYSILSEEDTVSYPGFDYLFSE